MAQDADNKCHTFETLEITTAENTNKEKEQGIKTACTACDVQQPPAQTRCAGPAHQQQDVFASTNKNCPPQNGCHGKLCQHKDVQGSASSCSLSLYKYDQNSSPPAHTMYLRMDFVSHWTRHDTVFYGMRFSAHRQPMSHLTSAAFANDW